MSDQLGSGKYRAEIASPGADGSRGPTKADLSDATSLIRWGRRLDGISSAQGAFRTSSECCDDLAMMETIGCEYRVLRDGEIVWEGPITRKETTSNTVRILAQDVMWWGTGRFIPGGALTGQTLDVEEIVRSILEGTFDRTFNGQPMDPALVDFITSNPSGLFGSPTISADDYRLVREELDTWAKTALDWTVVKRATLINPEATFPSLDLADIIGDPKIIERGDLYATDVVVIGGDGVTLGIATVESVLDVTVPGHLRREVRLIVESVTDQRSLQQIAETEIRSRYPSPVEITMGSGAHLSPKAPICIEQLIPGAVGFVSLTGYCSKRSRQLSKITEVDVRVDSKGKERVSIKVVPVGSGYAG